MFTAILILAGLSLNPLSERARAEPECAEKSSVNNLKAFTQESEKKLQAVIPTKTCIAKLSAPCPIDLKEAFNALKSDINTTMLLSKNFEAVKLTDTTDFSCAKQSVITDKDSFFETYCAPKLIVRNKKTNKTYALSCNMNYSLGIGTLKLSNCGYDSNAADLAEMRGGSVQGNELDPVQIPYREPIQYRRINRTFKRGTTT